LTEKEPDMKMKKEEQESSKTTIEEDFVIYDPDNLSYEKLYICEYLRGLPDLEEENPKTD
jgi:hypothetical protein